MPNESDDPDSEPETTTDGEAASRELPEGIPDPESPPDFATDSHVLPEDELVYPTFAFDTGDVSVDEEFRLAQELDREEMQSWLDSLAGGLGSHDIAVEGENDRATFGVAPEDVQISFEPGEGERGRLSVTFSLDATVVRVVDADERPLGARGERGFIPTAMLTGDRDPDEFRCYNWVDDPTEAGDGGEEDQ